MTDQDTGRAEPLLGSEAPAAAVHASAILPPPGEDVVSLAPGGLAELNPSPATPKTPEPAPEANQAPVSAAAVDRTQRPDLNTRTPEPDETAEQEFGLSLQQCFQRLSDPADLGPRAPAYVTLKRWSASGALDAAILRAPGRRQTYDLAGVRAVCIAHGRAKGDAGGATQLPVAAPPGAGSAGALPGALPGELAAMVQEIAGRLDALETSSTALRVELLAGMRTLSDKVARASAAAAGLDGVQRSLMLRYDAETAALREHIASLKEQLSAAGLRPSSAPGGPGPRFGTR